MRLFRDFLKGPVLIEKKLLRLLEIRGFVIKMKEMKYIVRVDEVGRGPIAGPVSVCALVCGISWGAFSGVKDSKKLSEKRAGEMAYFN